MWYRQSYVSEVRTVPRFQILRISVVLKVVIVNICRTHLWNLRVFISNKSRVSYHQLTSYKSFWLWRWLPHKLSKRQSPSTSPIQIFVHPDDPAPCTYEMTPVFKPFLVSCCLVCEWQLEYKCDVKLSSVFTAPTGFYGILDPNEGIAFFSSGRPSHMKVQPFSCN